MQLGEVQLEEVDLESLELEEVDLEEVQLEEAVIQGSTEPVESLLERFNLRHVWKHYCNQSKVSHRSSWSRARDQRLRRARRELRRRRLLDAWCRMKMYCTGVGRA